ncbi:ATP-grasp domain-containing protein [Actinophytocola sediminis]
MAHFSVAEPAPAVDLPTGSTPRILYLFPDRSSATLAAWERDRFWPVYEKVARANGLDFAVAVPEHVVLGDGAAYWRGERLRPERDIVVYDVRSEPIHEADLWSSLTLVRSLAEQGFLLAIPLSTALLCNDKFATAQALADSPVPVIPSVRVITGRDLDLLSYRELIPDDWFPAFVKPAYWGKGVGGVRCPDRSTLDALLGLASGSGATMLVQPLVGEVVADTRVVLVEGEIVAVYDRIAAAGSHVANVSRGGRVVERSDVDGPVRELAALVHRRFDLPYVCVDLLRTADGGWWFSELELDGAVAGLFDDQDAVARIVGGRFRAYASRLDRHLSPTSARRNP